MRKSSARKKHAGNTRKRNRNKKRAGSKAASKQAVARRNIPEPSSGSASSSLDPRRIGRLTLQPRAPQSRRGRLAGDDQGISRNESLDSESVEELLEEGQSLEGSIVEGVENARDADQGEVRTHEAREDDLREEYENPDR